MKSTPEEIELLLFDRHVRSTIMEILRINSRERSPFSEIISQELRRKKNLSSKRRRAISNATYMMIRMQRLIDFLLQSATRDSQHKGQGDIEEDSNLARFAMGLLTIDGLTAAEIAQGDFPPWIATALMSVGTVQEACSKIENNTERLAIQSSMPAWFAEKIVSDRGHEEASQLLHAMNNRAPLTIRANTLKTTPSDLIQRLADEDIVCEPCSLSPYGLRLRDHRNIRALYSYRKGLFEAQDEGSQLIAQLVSPPPKGKVLDLCAGAGGKTLALAAIMENQGELIATDIDSRRLGRLKPRLQRSGAKNISLFPWDKKLPKGWRGRADRILLDAPCSGSGTLRRNPGVRWQLSQESISNLSVTQAEIITNAIRLVRPGGWIIYATCSVLSEENESVVEQIVSEHPRLEIVPVTDVLGKDLGSKINSGPYMRMGPHTHDSDGFFAAVIKLNS